MMTDVGPTGRPSFMDDLGRLCHDGLDIARYLHQVPDDENERTRLRGILEKILADPAARQRTELPTIAQEMLDMLKGPPAPMEADLFQDGFDRLVKLWGAARSGIGRPTDGLPRIE